MQNRLPHHLSPLCYEFFFCENCPREEALFENIVRRKKIALSLARRVKEDIKKSQFRGLHSEGGGGASVSQRPSLPPPPR